MGRVLFKMESVSWAHKLSIQYKMVRASLPIQTPHSSMGVFHWRAVLRIFDFTRQRRFCVQASQFQKERLCVFKCSFTAVQCLNVRFLSLNVQVLSAISARRRLNIVGMNIDVLWCHNWITLNTKHHWRWTPPTPPSSHLPVVESVNLDSVVSPPHWALL